MKNIPLFGLLIVLLVACNRSTEPAAPAESSNASSADTKITIDEMPVPARYSAPLPTSVAGMLAWVQDDPSAPPVSHTVDSILNGDSRWLLRFSQAANAVPAAEATAYARKWADLFRLNGPHSDFCTQTRSLMSGPPTTARAALAVPFADVCAQAGDLPLIVRADTPSSAVLMFYSPWHSDGAAERHYPFHPRLIEAAREAILQPQQLDARSAAFTLINQHDAKADAALLAIHAQIKDQSRADPVALAFLESANAEGLKRAQAACTRMPEDPMCKRDRRTLAEGLAKSGDDEDGADKPISADAVKARVAQLQSLGFDRLDASKLGHLDSDSADVILTAAGLAYWFDVETGTYPNEHDSLMRTLALLVAPDLKDAVFAETPPAGAEDESSPYELTAYANGKRYRTQAQNYGDWFDVDATLRLLNKVMEDRKAPERFTSLHTTDQTLTVVAATPTTLDKAVKAGLLKVGDDSRDAERRGKQVERDVIEEVLPRGEQQ